MSGGLTSLISFKNPPTFTNLSRSLARYAHDDRPDFGSVNWTLKILPLLLREGIAAPFKEEELIQCHQQINDKESFQTHNQLSIQLYEMYA